MDLDAIKEWISYDPSTGKFVWLKDDFVHKKSSGREAGSTSKRDGYIRISICKSIFLAHRLAYLLMTGSMPTFFMDHKNGIRTDNRWENLRPATSYENVRNCKAKAGKKDSPLKGVYRSCNGKKWRSSICVNRKQISLGTFDREVDAHEAYKTAARQLHGDFAKW